MAVSKLPFESQYGFKGPNFSVDDQGNVIANSITLSVQEEEGVETPADFVVTESNSEFVFANINGNNPSITLSRGSSYIFDLELEVLNFTIFTSELGELLDTGLSHSDGTINVNAQSKKTGRLVFTVSSNLPDSLFYGSVDQLNRDKYIINIVDPDGSFDKVTINNTQETNDRNTGALVVAGGTAIQGNLFVDNNLYITDIKSSSNLKFDINEGIVFLSNDSSEIGTITDTGSTIPLLDTNIENTTIGTLTPAEASFTIATASNSPTNNNDLTNKIYVDTTVTALSIALGI